MYKGNGIFELTKNVLPRKKILGIPRRNWIECIIFTGIVEAVIFSIPFTKTASFYVFCSFWRRCFLYQPARYLPEINHAILYFSSQIPYEQMHEASART